MAFPDNLRSLGELRSRYRRARHGGQAGGVAFVFQGGGSLSAPQVGMLRALSEAGVLPDLVVGSSAGALNAVAFASRSHPGGPGSAGSARMSLRRRKFASSRPGHCSPRPSAAAMAWSPTPGCGTCSQRRAVRPRWTPHPFRRTWWRPTWVRARRWSFLAGQTGPALLASCAFPGLYPPVEVAGRLLVDGGVSADVPVLQAEALGAAVIYVLPAAGCDVTAPPPAQAAAAGLPRPQPGAGLGRGHERGRGPRAGARPARPTPGPPARSTSATPPG